MKRLVLAAIAAGLLASPVGATPYREFVDFKRRATPGDTVIRAFPNATSPSFRLILSAAGTPSEVPFEGMFCAVWLEFVQRGLPVDHFGDYGVAFDDPTERGRNFRELVEGPLMGVDERDEHGRLGEISSFREDLHWVARGTNDALHLVRADVGLDESGACVAGTHVRFTPNLAYRDVVDRQLLADFGEARIRGFPGDDPTYTLFLEFLPAGTVVDFSGFTPMTLVEDGCVLSLELDPAARPFWTPDLSALSDYFVGNRLFLISSGGLEPGFLAPIEGTLGETRPFVSQTTLEAFVIVDAVAALSTAGCEGRARIQFAPSIEDFYR